MDVLGVVELPIWLALTALAATLLYVYSSWNHSYFIKRGIPGPKPNPFIIGHTNGFGFIDKLDEWRKKYGNVFGIFLGQEPAYVISDLKMLKEIFIKSFSNFRDRRKFGFDLYPFNLTLFFLEGDAWKRVRNIVSPTFSSGKLRWMVAAINDCSRILTNNFKKQIKPTKGVDMKEHFGAYTMDVIARTAFGIQVDSQNDFSDPFVSHAKRFFEPRSTSKPAELILAAFPFIVPIILKIGITFFNNASMTFFLKNITEMIRLRRMQSAEEKKNRVDFLQLLIDAEVMDDDEGAARLDNPNKWKKELSTDEIIGQCLLFFFAGYETMATALTFASYCLATNPNIQDKVYNEILELMGDEEPTYDTVGKLNYLEKFVLEILRMYPPTISLNRTASETIKINGITIEKGRTIYIPIFSIQRDPELYPEPMTCTPERHEDVTDPMSFLTFGQGPRHCIGMRLAMLSLKIALVHVMKNVKFEPLPDTPKLETFVDGNFLKLKIPLLLKVTTR